MAVCVATVRPRPVVKSIELARSKLELRMANDTGDDTDRGEERTCRFMVRLQQERGPPPLGGMWLIREVIDVRYAFAGDAGVDTSE